MISLTLVELLNQILLKGDRPSRQISASETVKLSLIGSSVLIEETGHSTLVPFCLCKRAVVAEHALPDLLQSVSDAARSFQAPAVLVHPSAAHVADRKKTRAK